VELAHLPGRRERKVVGAQLVERAAVGGAGAAFASTIWSVMACKSARYDSSNGRPSSARHCAFQSFTSRQVSRRMPYSKMAVNGSSRQPFDVVTAPPTGLYDLNGYPGGMTSPNTKRNSPRPSKLTFDEL
jgi:hypothetical protein